MPRIKPNSNTTSKLRIPGSLALEYTGRTGYEKPKRLYVSGTISRDGPQFAESPPGTGAMQVAVIQHELGPLLGPNHVDDPGDLAGGVHRSRW